MPYYLTTEDNGPTEEFSAKNNKAAIKKMKKMAQNRMLGMSLFRLVESYEPVYTEEGDDIVQEKPAKELSPLTCWWCNFNTRVLDNLYCSELCAKAARALD